MKGETVMLLIGLFLIQMPVQSIIGYNITVSEETVETQPPEIKYKSHVETGYVDNIEILWRDSGLRIRNFNISANLWHERSSQIIISQSSFFDVGRYILNYTDIPVGNYTWHLTMSKQGIKSQNASLKVEVFGELNLKPIAFEGTIYGITKVSDQAGPVIFFQIFIWGIYELDIDKNDYGYVLEPIQSYPCIFTIGVTYSNGTHGSIIRYEQSKSDIVGEGLGYAAILLNKEEASEISSLNSVQVEVLSPKGSTRILELEMDTSDLTYHRFTQSNKEIAELDPNFTLKMIIGFGLIIVVIAVNYYLNKFRT